MLALASEAGIDVDSFALIPLAWIGRLDLVSTAFDGIRTTDAVREEVLTEGKRGTAVLDEFLADVTADKAVDVRYDLVNEGMNLHPRWTKE